MKGNFIFVLTLFLSLFAMAFEPFSEKDKQIFRFDLKKNFYQNEEQYRADILKGKEIVSKIESHKGKVGSSAKELLELYDLMNDYTSVYYRLYAYGEFREAINTKDREAIENYYQFSSESESKMAFIKVELKNLTEEKFKQFLKEEPKLEKYSFFINDTVRKAPYYLSKDKEEILSKLSPTRFEWQSALFQLSFDRTNFGTVLCDGASYEISQNFDALMKCKDRSTREKVFKDYFKGLESISDLCGFALFNLIKSLNEEAKMRGFENEYDESLFDSYIRKEEIENIFSQLEENVALYSDYQKFKLENAKKVENIDSAEIWDSDVTLKDAKDLRVTAMEAVDLVKKALSPLGEKYSKEIATLLNPRNGRIDLVGGPNRRQGAFCEAGFGFFQDNFQGYLSDVSTIAHESGHAIHHRLTLLYRNGEMFSQGPPYLTESFAMFNEYLLRDYLLKTLKDEKERKGVIFDFLNEQMYLWEVARRAKFEMVSYDEVSSGKIKDENGFNDVCVEVGKKYDIFFDRYPQLKYIWLRKHHYVSVPTYYKNYVIAQILAIKYYELYKKDPQGFAKKYVAMVENGIDREPQKLLKDFLGIDLNDKNLLKDMFPLIKNNFDELKKM